jgi:siroheme synthase
MGLGRSASIACDLVDRGWAGSTPAAVIVDGWTADQQVWRGTLDDLAADRIEIDRAGAGTIVIGDVVAVAVSRAEGLGARGLGLEIQARG